MSNPLTSGGLLQGIRLATGNNAFTFPPRSIVSNQTTLNSISSVSEYAIFVSGQKPGNSGIDIGDQNLVFNWTRNDSISRFDWDGFSKRWNTLPGIGQEILGPLSNSTRLVAPIPDQSISSLVAPYYIYVGSPTRIITFTVVIVADSSYFTNPPSGTLQISANSGEINFNNSDVSNPAFANKTVYLARQNFLNRSQSKGQIGILPQSSSSSYNLWLNPIPGVGFKPRVRIGYREYLKVNQYSTDSLLQTPVQGEVSFSLETGKILFSKQDIDLYPGETVYYDGVIIGSFSLVTSVLGSPYVWPNHFASSANFVGLEDATKYVFFASRSGSPNYYFKTNIVNSAQATANAPDPGSINVDYQTGKVYLNSIDNITFDYVMNSVDTIHVIENGVSVQFFRSGANSSGESVVPDFVEKYSVSNQIIADNISASPFIFLPTTPLIDSSLVYTLSTGSGGGGTLVGPLVDAKDSTKTSYGYFLDLDTKQLSFSSRISKDIILEKPSPYLNLTGAVIPFGLVFKKNNTQIFQGIDFDYDSTSGLIRFVEPVGEGEKSNIIGVSGTITLPNKFVAESGSFPTDSLFGKYLFVNSGPNIGFYKISNNENTTTVYTVESFSVSGPETVDIRDKVEIIVDRVWKPFTQKLKKITVKRGPSINGPFIEISSTDDFTVLASSGQINLTTPMSYKEVVKINYTSLDEDDSGVVVSSTPREEFGGFKVKREIATYIQNTGIIKFNPDNRTVLETFPIRVCVDGETIDNSSLSFVSPGTINTAFVLTNQFVTVDYFVAEAVGGETNFNLLHSPIDIDFVTIVGTSSSNDPTSIFNGNQLSSLYYGVPILVNETSVYVVKESSYDSLLDQTSVKFFAPPASDIVNPSLSISEQIVTGYQEVESGLIDTIPQGSNSFNIIGSLVSKYPPGTVVTINSDSYLVLSSSLSDDLTKTNVVLSDSTKQNYIIFSLSRTVRPILFPTNKISTKKPLSTAYSRKLFKSGITKKFLVEGVDYSLSDGGLINLSSPIQYGDSITSVYVASLDQPAGTVFNVNYASLVSPNSSNGILQQRLSTSYNLYNPDTFYFKIQTFASFLPEVVQLLKSSSTSGTGGPNVNDIVSLSNKDYGTPSLYFNEQFLANVDDVVSRLLKSYNDVINSLEDILANIDGRVVGGTSGRFKFDGVLNNPPRSTYDTVTNDIDDKIEVYKVSTVTSLSPFTITYTPVYIPIWENNNFSRFYPTKKNDATVAFNNNTSFPFDFGKTLGNFGVTKITSNTDFGVTKARGKFSSRVGTKVSMVGTNGDPSKLVPSFFSGQKVNVYGPDGTLDVNTNISLVEGTYPYSLYFSSPYPTVPYGSVVADVLDQTAPGVKFYTSSNVGIDSESGDVKFEQWPPPLGPSTTVSGNELVDSTITFINQATTPLRIPALDGQELTDLGQVSNPLLTYSNENDLFSRELIALSHIGVAAVQADLVTITGSNVSVIVGNQVKFLNGPNVGVSRTVSSVISPTSFTVGVAFPSIDVSGTNTVYVVQEDDLFSILSNEVSTLSTQVPVAPVSPAIIGKINSQYKSVNKIVNDIGYSLASGTGVTTSNTITDVSKNFLLTSPPVGTSSFLFISSGANYGVYKILSATSTAITIDTAFPSSSFPSSLSGVPYSVIIPYSFFSLAIVDFLANFLRSTIAFTTQTLSWQSSVVFSGISNRTNQIVARKSFLATSIQNISNLLSKSLKLYDKRYLWIQQRIDKKIGTLVQKTAAIAKRSESTTKLVQDQIKLLTFRNL